MPVIHHHTVIEQAWFRVGDRRPSKREHVEIVDVHTRFPHAQPYVVRASGGATGAFANAVVT